jgi:phage portal protein BeeE
MGFNGAFSDICSSGANTGTSYMGGFGGFSSGSGSNAAINYKKSLTLTAVYNAVEQISNDIAKYRFPLTKKRQQPRIKIISTQSLFRFLLTA